MDDSQNVSFVGERLETMHELMEQVRNLQKEGSSNRDAVARVKEIIAESGKLVETSKGASELVMDGKILNTGSFIIKQHVVAFDAALKTFDPDEYTQGVIKYVENCSTSSTLVWDALAEDTYSMFKKVPTLDYMLGTFKLDPPPPAEKRKVQRSKAANEGSKSVVKAVDQTETSTEVTDEIYKHILKCLVISYRHNNRQPICYFSFVVDPSDFWVTVQNIFHFSFLVRDNKVKMSLDEKGVPVVEPLLSKGDDDGEQSGGKNFQFNFRITPFEYRNLIEAFHIKKASIPRLAAS